MILHLATFSKGDGCMATLYVKNEYDYNFKRFSHLVGVIFNNGAFGTLSFQFSDWKKALENTMFVRYSSRAFTSLSGEPTNFLVRTTTIDLI